ncbi:MAG: putative Na+/H+ antiporter [Opitutaceae bacterium]|nr:putative Na+/H+ antiporter [Opitutaceae bacterium]
MLAKSLAILAGLTVVTPALCASHPFPRPVSDYATNAGMSLWQVLAQRIAEEPFNLVASLIFCCAIMHTFLAPKFRHWAHVVEAAHAARSQERPAAVGEEEDNSSPEVSFQGQLLHFLGEVEVVFGIWALALMLVLGAMKGWATPIDYIGHRVNFTEPMFVVVIMALASTRPVLNFAERCLRGVASLGRGTASAWWLTVLIIAPLLGSLITEPAAMTIAALLLARQFYVLRPSPKLAYATLGLLFVNISVGGTLTHFAAPPVLMVAGPWQWDLAFMFTHFGWRAMTGIVTATLLYFMLFRRELAALNAKRSWGEDPVSPPGADPRPIPFWITLVQLGFMLWTVLMAHYPALFIAGFLFFLAFSQATGHHQSRLDLRPPLLVGFFLAGLVVHGGLQGWWIEPLLTRLQEWPLFFGATVLTAFNDNAAITYLATLVDGFGGDLKYAVVAGAVTGGGLTVIANAPNPAGQSLLQRFFPEGVSPLGLALGAALPTLIMAACFMVL